jgi:hypothetical protein
MLTLIVEVLGVPLYYTNRCLAILANLTHRQNLLSKSTKRQAHEMTYDFHNSLKNARLAPKGKITAGITRIHESEGDVSAI